VVVQVKALACELPAASGVPLSRWSATELAGAVVERGLVASISGSTVWRWLNADAIRPWHHRSWIFPRDPDFATKAGRVLDLYHGYWQGEGLTDEDFVLCADEKTSIQVRRRQHVSAAPRPHQAMRVEHEYQRAGAWAYLAAWDVKHARLVGRCEPSTGIEPFHRLLADVLAQPPYSHARRLFFIVDNGSSHRGRRSIQRCQDRYPKHPQVILVHLPIHASWLNQIEIYFSIVQRKLLTPNDFTTPNEVPDRLLAFQQRYQAMARPFQWQFTRHDLAELITKLNASPDTPLAQAA